jgi:hypothetical protein
VKLNKSASETYKFLTKYVCRGGTVVQTTSPCASTPGRLLLSGDWLVMEMILKGMVCGCSTFFDNALFLLKPVSLFNTQSFYTDLNLQECRSFTLREFGKYFLGRNLQTDEKCKLFGRGCRDSCWTVQSVPTCPEHPSAFLLDDCRYRRLRLRNSV